ncbi:MAG: hypothetical protein DBX97_23285 [Collinsella tanakaei]|nr:MAG: hypothetical protein DBX97_23285 [Collinsella tanakaei]
MLIIMIIPLLMQLVKKVHILKWLAFKLLVLLIGQLKILIKYLIIINILFVLLELYLMIQLYKVLQHMNI